MKDPFISIVAAPKKWDGIAWLQQKISSFWMLPAPPRRAEGRQVAGCGEHDLSFS
jgi:hypothetical protein